MWETLKDLWESPWQRIPDLHAVTTLVCCALLWLVVWRDDDGFIFILDHANLMFHEAGHPIYGVLGPTMALYGGTLGQLTFPVVVTVSGWLRRHAVMVATGLVWLGQNLINIARYAADARAQELPLIGGGEHDWANILGRWNALNKDLRVAATFRTAGWVLMVGATLWLAWQWRRSREEDDALE